MIINYQKIVVVLKEDDGQRVQGFGSELDSSSPSRIAHIKGQRMSRASIDFLTFLVRNVDGNRRFKR